MHHYRPASTSMEQLLAGALQQIPNYTLGNFILKVGIHATKSKLLVVGLTCLLEGIVDKLSVVTVIVLDADAMLSGKLLKHLLGKDGLTFPLMDLSTITKKHKIMQYSTTNYMGTSTRVFVVRQS